MDLKKGGDVPQVRVKKTTIKATIKDDSLASWESLFESSSLVDKAEVPYLYSIFTFEPLHNILLVVSKLLKHCMFQ